MLWRTYFGQGNNKRSGLLEPTADGVSRFEAGDAIMADNWFDDYDLFRSHNIALNHPPFLRGINQFSEEQLVETRRIAFLRLHVERTIERIKIYCILGHIPSNLRKSGSQLVRVCTFLTTLMPPLLPFDDI